MQRFTLTTITVVALTCVAVAYARFTRPMLKVTSMPVAAFEHMEPPAPSPDFVTMAQRYLPDQAWAVDAPYRHRDDSSFIYTQRYLLGNDGRSVSLKPFAAVMSDGTASDGKPDRPVTLVAEAAQVDFLTELDDREFDVGRMTSGQLLGEVRIEGPDGLLIIGRNFFVSESSKRIWSDDIVRFRYGTNRGYGRGIEIRLAMPAEENDDGLLAADGIRTVRVRENVVLRLLDDSDKQERKPPVEIEVTSEGHLEFDLETNIANLERDVVVRYPAQSEQADTLKCDTLSIQFEEQKTTDSERATEESSRLVPLQLMAQGHIELQSLQNELTATQVTDLTYLLEERIIEIANTMEFASGSGPPMRIVQSSNVIQCRRMVLVHNEQNEVTSALIRGPGVLESSDPETNQVTAAAHWMNEMRLEPDPTDASRQVLRIAGSATVVQPLEGSRMSADLMRLWFVQIDRKQADSPSDARNVSGLESIRGFQPVRLVAEHNVRLQTPQMSGPTDRLTIDFEQPDSVVRNGRHSFQVASFRNDETPREKSGSLKEIDETFRVRADSIYARVRLGAKKTKTETPEVRLEGRVRVDSFDKHQQPSLKLSGDELRILQDGSGSQAMKLVGNPKTLASVRQKDRTISGLSIYLDRSANEAEVVGNGSMRVLVDKDLEGKPLEIPQPLEIVWAEDMQFDGKVVDLRGKVTAKLGTDQTQRQELICPRMKIHFTQQLNFTKSMAGGNDRELGKLLKSIECIGGSKGVRVNNFKFSQGRIVEERHALFRDMTLDQKSGDMVASGPGWITSWTQDRPKLSRAVSARANASASARQGTWNYTRIDYMGALEGNYRDRLSTFKKNVHIIYGEVERLSQVIAPDETADFEMPDQAVRIECDQLRVSQREVSRGTRTIELLGTGNTKMEGRKVVAKADEVRYDEYKELSTLVVRGNRSGTIWQRDDVGKEWRPAAFRRVEYSHRRQQLKATGVGGIAGSR